MKTLIFGIFFGLLVSATSALAVPRASAPTPDNSSTLGLAVLAFASLLALSLNLKRKAFASSRVS